MSRGQGPASGTEAAEEGKWSLYLLVAGGVLLLDIVTKFVAERTLPLYQPVPVLGDYVRLTYIFNPGAAFGLHFGGYSRYIFVVLTVAILTVLFFWYRATPRDFGLRLVAIALVTGGAIGNLIDRVRSHRGVVDFFDVGFGTLRWPVFNIADIAVTSGALLLALSLWQEEREMAEHEGRERDAG